MSRMYTAMQRLTSSHLRLLCRVSPLHSVLRGVRGGRACARVSHRRETLAARLCARAVSVGGPLARHRRALARSRAARAGMRFRLKTEFLTYAHSQIRGGLWYKPTWWEAVQRVPPCAVLPRPRKSTIPRLRFVEDALMRCVAAGASSGGGGARAAHPASPRTHRAAPRAPPHVAASSPRATPRCAPWTRATLRAGARRRWLPSSCLRSCAT